MSTLFDLHNPERARPAGHVRARAAHRPADQPRRGTVYRAGLVRADPAAHPGDAPGGKTC
jgi:hypothetical protein